MADRESGEGLRVGIGAADKVINAEHSVVNLISNAVPEPRDIVLFKKKLRSIGRKREERALRDHLFALSDKRERRPAIVLLVGEPDDMPRAFAERVMPSKLEEIRLPYHSLDFADWPEPDFHRLIGEMIRQLVPNWSSMLNSWRLRRPEDKASFLKGFIRKHGTSLCFAHEINIAEGECSLRVLEDWFEYFGRTCENPPRSNLLVAVLCVSGLGAANAAADWLRRRLDETGSDSALYVVRLQPLRREQVEEWVTAYNDDPNCADEMPRGAVQQLFDRQPTLSYRQVRDGLLDIARTGSRPAQTLLMGANLVYK